MEAVIFQVVDELLGKFVEQAGIFRHLLPQAAMEKNGLFLQILKIVMI